MRLLRVVLPLSIEESRLLNRIHLRGWGLKLTLTAVFFVALGTRVRGVRSKITLVARGCTVQTYECCYLDSYQMASSPCSVRKVINAPVIMLPSDHVAPLALV